MTQKFYVTTPIYYVNGDPHIGHAYTSVAADVIARFHRLNGEEVFFLTGTDEHGQKVEQSAIEKNIDPQDFASNISARFREMSDLMEISYDDFIRTTQPHHIKGAQALWKTIEEKNYLYQDVYEGWYAKRDECYYDESELKVNSQGKKIAPTGAEVEWIEEPSFFFRLSQFEKPLLEFYEKHPEFLGPLSTHNEIVSFVQQGLKDLSVSRTSFSWGVPVPGHPQHVMYVWFDALSNYITALGYPDTSQQRWKFWPAHLHLVGKDIARFHAVYWPAFLMAAGLPLPKKIFANGWWTVEGQKMSKSIGNVVSPKDLVEAFGCDTVRYFLLREVPLGKDSDLSKQALITRHNVDLANDLGNLAQRTLSMIAKNCDGTLPKRGPLHHDDKEILGRTSVLYDAMTRQFEDCALTQSLKDIWDVIRACNGYIDRQAPWKLKKTDPQRMRDVLRIVADVIRVVAILLQPYMPNAMSRLLDQLGVEQVNRQFSALDHIAAGDIQLPKPQAIFPRFTEKEQ